MDARRDYWTLVAQGLDPLDALAASYREPEKSSLDLVVVMWLVVMVWLQF
jgi:hypothetical protein